MPFNQSNQWGQWNKRFLQSYYIPKSQHPQQHQIYK